MEIRKKIPCSIFRGGTSKGVYFLEKDIPSAGDERDAFLLRVMGSPDKRQIDGLGGATSVTSKVAIVAPSGREDADVDYTFAQVSVDKALVSYRGNCGNISSGVGPFAVEEGLVEAIEPVTQVRVFNTNTQKVIIEEVRVSGGQVQYRGETALDGVPGTASPVRMKFMDPAGTLTPGVLLPTGNVCDVLEIPGFGPVTVSIVDAANPLVFVRACDIGMTGTELPAEIDADEKLSALLERIRGEAAFRLGLVSDASRSAWECPGIPKMTVLSESQSYVTPDGKQIQQDDIDLTGRMMSMQRAHQTYALTGAMCTAAAAAVPGSVAAQVLSPDADLSRLRIGHPYGIIEAGAECLPAKPAPEIRSIIGIRTANLLMKGFFVDKQDS